MASRRWLRGQSDVTVSLSTPGPLTTLGASRSTGPFDEVRRVYGDFATALPSPASESRPEGPLGATQKAASGTSGCSDIRGRDAEPPLRTNWCGLRAVDAAGNEKAGQPGQHACSGVEPVSRRRIPPAGHTQT